MKRLAAEQILGKRESLSIIDVRSPKEFSEGHIPGAISMPIFDNDERAVVGTLYKQKGRQAAVLKGLEFVGPKMAQFAQEALARSVDGEIIVHCWRGGMRSESMAWLFERVGLKVYVLEGGYKAYRQFCASEMLKLKQLTVLKGATGSGKTEILHQLSEKGEQVIDLEGLANHRGSAFGGIGQAKQPTTQQFQNDLYESIRTLDFDQRIWVEGESKHIGKVYIPDAFWSMMESAEVVEIVVPLQDRVKRLVEDYAQLDEQMMVDAILKLEKRLGNKRMNEIVEVYKAKDYSTTSAMLLKYYDKSYSHSDKKQTNSIQKVELENGDAERNAEVLIAKLR